MEQQGNEVKDSGGVRFENVKVGRGCAVVLVSTIGQEVQGTGIDINECTTWYGGQMSDQSLQSLPKAHGTEESSMRDQSTENIGSRRYGAGRILGGVVSSDAGAKRPT
jgi:hypothetical protein